MSDNVPIRPTAPTEQELREWLAYEYGRLRDEAADLIAALRSMVIKYPERLDDAGAEIAAQNLTIAGALQRAANERRLEENAAYRVGQKTVNDWFDNHVTDAMRTPRDTIQRLLNDYGERQRGAQRGEAPVRVHGPMGSLSSGTVTWEFEVLDFAAIPDAFKLLDTAKINAARRERDLTGEKTGTKGKPLAEIPGGRWVQKFAMRNR
jgi:hypothetical protein